MKSPEEQLEIKDSPENTPEVASFDSSGVDVLFKTFSNPKDLYHSIQKYLQDSFMNEGELSTEKDPSPYISYLRTKIEEYTNNSVLRGKFDYLFLHFDTDTEYEYNPYENWTS